MNYAEQRCTVAKWGRKIIKLCYSPEGLNKILKLNLLHLFITLFVLLKIKFNRNKKKKLLFKC